MTKLVVLVLSLVFCLSVTSDVYGQDGGQRARELAAALDKTKYKKKEKRDINIEFYIDIKNEPVIKTVAHEHAGGYEDEMGMYRLDLHVLTGGVIEGSGHDTRGVEGKRVRFTLKDARIDGALLTGNKVFENGESEKFEAVFTNRTVRTGTNAASITSRESEYGIGFIQSNERWTSRVFMKRL